MKRFLNHLLVAVGAFASLLTMVSFFFSAFSGKITRS